MLFTAKRKWLLAAIAAVLLLTGLQQFIRLNNDHAECSEEVRWLKDKEGNTIQQKEHICREYFPI